MRHLSELFEAPEAMNKKEDSFYIKPEEQNPFCLTGKKRVHVLALGDVGSMLLIGLRLLGGDVVDSIGICDLDEKAAQRFEGEVNQIEYPVRHGLLPAVDIIPLSVLFDCDVMIFCASRGVPPVGGDEEDAKQDVRMAQLSVNVQLAGQFAQQAVKSGFRGLFAVVSDPVDPLCKAVYRTGLHREQVRGYGLGVMNSRALYYARKDVRFQSFLEEGRAFGPHGDDLVIANSLEHYDDGLSRELTRLAAASNLKTRELGFKPFIAPALSSGAISILETMRGNWQYSSLYFGKGQHGAFLGMKNRMTAWGSQVEDLPLPDPLFQRIEAAYSRLADLQV